MQGLPLKVLRRSADFDLLIDLTEIALMLPPENFPHLVVGPQVRPCESRVFNWSQFSLWEHLLLFFVPVEIKRHRHVQASVIVELPFGLRVNKVKIVAFCDHSFVLVDLVVLSNQIARGIFVCFVCIRINVYRATAQLIINSSELHRCVIDLGFVINQALPGVKRRAVIDPL